MQLVPKRDHVVKRRRATFASAAAAAEFGGKYFGWREWREFIDDTPEQIVELRFVAWSR